MRFILLAGGLALLLVAMITLGAEKEYYKYPSYTKTIVLFLTVAHVGLFHFIVRHLGQHPQDFVKIYLGTTVLRILFFGVFIFLILRLDPRSGTGNALVFLVSYFLFTGLEVAMLYAAVRDQKPRNSGQKGP